jgi:hypothetical protein
MKIENVGDALASVVRCRKFWMMFPQQIRRQKASPHRAHVPASPSATHLQRSSRRLASAARGSITGADYTPRIVSRFLPSSLHVSTLSILGRCQAISRTVQNQPCLANHVDVISKRLIGQLDLCTELPRTATAAELSIQASPQCFAPPHFRQLSHSAETRPEPHHVPPSS